MANHQTPEPLRMAGNPHYHAVLPGMGWQAAMCKAVPRGHTGGWSLEMGDHVTCPKCLAALAAVAMREAA